jgi:cell division protein ZapE
MRQTLMEFYALQVQAAALQADAAQIAVVPQLEALRSALETPPRRRFLQRKAAAPPVGLYLWGGVGRGKSMLMDALFTLTDIAEKRRVHFHAFMQDIHHAMHIARQKGVDDALAPVASEFAHNLRLLALDEMQISDITDAMIVGRLFEMLLAQGVAIVTTSNRAPQDLYKNGLNREYFLPFIDILQQRLQVIELRSPQDYRQHRLAGAQVYFHPAGTVGGKLAQIWDDLTGQAPGAPLHLAVNGRKITLPRVANGVAYASFWDLCAQAYGPADYLAIAAAVRVLILRDIPQLSASNYNEAKRFVTLIDALYEAHVRLICSAADVPERLYIEGAGSFEFERTASRLREMQGADWGADWGLTPDLPQ